MPLCHASESWHPAFLARWMPAFAGMTPFLQHLQLHASHITPA